MLILLEVKAQFSNIQFISFTLYAGSMSVINDVIQESVMGTQSKKHSIFLLLGYSYTIKAQLIWRFLPTTLS